MLGHGGSGRVWKAVHRPSGRTVAVKTLAATTAVEKEAFRREVYALRQLRHPGVVSVLEHGVSGNSPWFSMELVEGRAFDDWMRETTDWTLQLRGLRSLCETLSHVHGEGVVHRDLKPSNVLVRHGSDVPVLIDFGLASRFVGKGVREILEVGGSFSGSFEYAAPEQLLGQFVDARADLYAIGCMLHEILCGVPPYRGTLQDIVTGHLSGSLPELRPRDERIPAVLIEGARQLLARNARDRMGFARDVVRLIDDALGEPRPGGYSGLGRTYFYRPGFAGRTQALEKLREMFAASGAAAGGCVLVKGESGIGKTRLAMEFTRSLPARTTVITSECIAAEGHDAWRGQSAPMEAWRPVLRHIAACCAEGGDGLVDHVLGDRAGILAQIEPELAPFASGEISRLTGSAARDRLIESLVATVRRFTERHRIVVIVDDLQWTDELTLACLDRFQRGEEGFGGMFVIGTYRPEEASVDVHALAASRPVIELLPMDPDAVASILSDMLALTERPETLLSFLVRESEGNPFFVSEYLFAAADAGFLQRTDDGRWVLDPEAKRSKEFLHVRTPGSVRELVQRRFRELSDAATRFLEAGAVLGRILEAPIAASVAELADEESAEAVLQLMQRRILDEDSSGRLRFSHDKLREVGYAGIEAGRARTLHRRAASEIEARYRDDPGFPEHYGELALHHQAAGSLAEATEYFGRAGEHAFARGAFQEATQYLGAALESRLPGDTRTIGRRHRMLGNSQFAIGDLQRCIRETEVALETLGVRIPRRTAGWAWMAAREAARLATRTAGRGRGGADSEERSIAATQLGASFYYEAKLVPSAAAVMLGVNEAERCAVPARLADAYSRLGYVSGAAGLHGLAGRWFERAHRFGEQEDDTRPLVLSLYMDGMYRLGVAQWSRALELGERSWRLGLESASIQDAEVGRTIMAHAMFYSGRISDSQREYRSILETSALRANVQHMGWGLFLSGRASLALGRVEEAYAAIEEGYGHLSGLPDAVSRAMSAALLALAALRSGHLDRAAGIADDLLARFRSGWHPAVGQCVDAYGCLAETALGLEQAEPSAEARRRSDRCLVLLRLFSAFFPVAGPVQLRCRALRARLRGNDREAARLARRAAARAASLDMPFEQLLACREWERFPAEAETARRELREAARRIDGGSHAL